MNMTTINTEEFVKLTADERLMELFRMFSELTAQVEALRREVRSNHTVFGL